MNGWLYIIKNGDLYKIGITRNLENRMRQLKPDTVIAKLYSSEFKQLEKEFHKRYKNVRIPQTEYFRLNHKHILEIKKRISKLHYPMGFTFEILKDSIILVSAVFIVVICFTFITSNEDNNVLLTSFRSMGGISLNFSFLSLLIKSKKNLSRLNEIKYRVSRFIILILVSYFLIFLLDL